MISSIRAIPLILVLLIVLFGCPGTSRAETTVVYPVQSGLIADGSCCSPYAYANSSSPTFAMTGCFNDFHYGCFQWRERAAWRWNLDQAVPENAVVTSAHVHWNHPSACQALNVYVWIDAGSQILSSVYCNQIRNNPDQQFSQQSYNGSSVTWSIDESVLDDALNGGYLSVMNQIGYDGQGCVLQNTGNEGIRIVIEYELVSCEGDFNGNGAIDVDDLLVLVSNYGLLSEQYDLDGNGFINVNDVLLMLDYFGSSCE